MQGVPSTLMPFIEKTLFDKGVKMYPLFFTEAGWRGWANGGFLASADGREGWEEGWCPSSRRWGPVLIECVLLSVFADLYIYIASYSYIYIYLHIQLDLQNIYKPHLGLSCPGTGGWRKVWSRDVGQDVENNGFDGSIGCLQQRGRCSQGEKVQHSFATMNPCKQT